MKKNAQEKEKSIHIFSDASSEAYGAAVYIWLMQSYGAEKVTGPLQMEIEDIIFRCDSMNVLWWVRNQSCKLKPFVASRVGLIHSQTDPNQWRYIQQR